MGSEARRQTELAGSELKRVKKEQEVEKKRLEVEQAEEAKKAQDTAKGAIGGVQKANKSRSSSGLRSVLSSMFGGRSILG